MKDPVEKVNLVEKIDLGKKTDLFKKLEFVWESFSLKRENTQAQADKISKWSSELHEFIGEKR